MFTFHENATKAPILARLEPKNWLFASSFSELKRGILTG
ncbi:hypothetical protein CEV32_0954 [Brucella rhizosphaerae]|uniref:Uncharacterized protein n=1 Tax=Brucella rhizosphaerae TaxID=571254 RepID=A0A256FDF7_9HYPH|nr:hypothetical protein CEV32_0954 [Brucella rhizosphaerae]